MSRMLCHVDDRAARVADEELTAMTRVYGETIAAEHQRHLAGGGITGTPAETALLATNPTAEGMHVTLHHHGDASGST
ncbi:hypothetical protein AB0J72_34040 [Dactylosporangium sp. NPDC049742]|uniref:hypothetical protein n=1 Tax=Dactylosporangium sp. NPDC049742 TaxID=3154737 RepID=UPI003413EAA9